MNDDDDDDISNIESRFFATVKSQIAASTRQAGSRSN